jgi:hypothetical protein
MIVVATIYNPLVPGLIPGTHALRTAFAAESNPWMAGSSPATGR